MLKKILACSLLLVASHCAQGQAAFTTRDSVNINHINASVLVHGDMWWDPVLQLSKCFFPKGSPTCISFVGALWMSGYDAGGQLHIAAQTYRQNGNDYWPGPLNSADTLTYASSHDWAKIWKVNRTDIQYFQSLGTHTTANTPASILTWPASGNTYAAGNGGAALTIPSGTSYAPFVDLNSNGIYEPLLGEYPDVPGDQALWYMFSDNGPTHTETHGKPLGVEVHALAYAYSRGTLIDNVIYYQYKVVNHSTNNYTNFRVTQSADMDLGYYHDDLIGFDSVHRLGIVYNGNNDDGVSGGYPTNSYHSQIPVAGVTMIKLPGDAPGSFVPVGSFTYYNNDFSIIGNPATANQYNNYMRSRLRDSSFFTNDYAGPGVAAVGYGSGPVTNYVFPGNPANPAQWSECSAGNTPGDRRFLISSNDFSLAAGGSQTIVMALITTNPDTSNGCPGVSFDSIGIVADTAWAVYFNPPGPTTYTGLSVATQSTQQAFLYPDPVHDLLTIDGLTGDVSIGIYNITGQKLPLPVTFSVHQAQTDVSQLPVGIYYVRLIGQDGDKTLNFVKQ